MLASLVLLEYWLINAYDATELWQDITNYALSLDIIILRSKIHIQIKAPGGRGDGGKNQAKLFQRYYKILRKRTKSKFVESQTRKVYTKLQIPSMYAFQNNFTFVLS